MAHIILFVVLILNLSHSMCHATPSNATKFPAALIFGDSTVDSGNNDYTSTLFKANHSPYGMNFPGGQPTGRFSDGMLVPDFLASFLGLKESIPPFLDPQLSDEDVKTGVNFASAGSGFDDLTTAISGAIPMSKQIEMFKSYIDRLKNVVGEQAATGIVNNALIVISAGSNDFIFNFYDLPTRSSVYNISGYQDFLLEKIRDIVKQIYDLGGRKIAIAGLSPIGCTPIQMTAKFSYVFDLMCVEEENSDVVAYNTKLAGLVSQVQASLAGSKVVYADLYTPFSDMFKNPQNYGFEETKRGCCGTGRVEMGPLCTALTPLCFDPSKFIFFDAIHPTQAVYKSLAKYMIDNVLDKLL
ncbi:GDSL esterase/lipase [Acorus gramineus]|uniref:GDSL esterase/lipase n=1 Tax=Acorus gramineus TaxID=55184 RepID=A0AAV9AJY0_ACOGR|nr:GDSL esterase/lipase [Acorus gramineus]